MTLKFNNSELNKIEKDFSKLDIRDDQAENVNKMAEFLCDFIDISKLSMRGFMWFVQKDWQQANQQDLYDAMMNANLKERQNIVRNLFTGLRNRLENILENKDDLHILDNKMKEATDIFLKTLN